MSPPERQLFEQNIVEWHRLAGYFGLAPSNTLPLRIVKDRTSDIGLLLLKINVAPLQREQFTATKSRSKRRRHKGNNGPRRTVSLVISGTLVTAFDALRSFFGHGNGGDVIKKTVVLAYRQLVTPVGPTSGRNRTRIWLPRCVDPESTLL